MIYTKFLERFLPASVVLDEEDTVLHFFGNYSDYFTLPPGKASLNFLSMLNRSLILSASTALAQCRHQNVPVTYTDIAFDCPGGHKVIDLTVQPIPGQSADGQLLTAILFLEHDRSMVIGQADKYDINTTAARRIADLEREFQLSQSNLRATIQRLETVNGELQAANEELLTTNKDL